MAHRLPTRSAARTWPTSPAWPWKRPRSAPTAG